MHFVANSPNGDVMLFGGGVGVWLLSGFDQPRVEKAVPGADQQLEVYLSSTSDYVRYNVASVAGGEFESEVEAGSTDPCLVLFRCTRRRGIACCGQYPTMDELRAAYDGMRNPASSVFIESRAA